MRVRSSQDGRVIDETVAEHLGVGEVFVGAGQSNSTNYSEARLKTASGMVASFGDALHAKLKVPVGVVVTGQGGSGIRKWTPGGDLYDWTLTRLRQLGPNGYRMVLWHRGEADRGMAADDYAAQRTQVIWRLKRTSGFDAPWMVAHASYRSPGVPADSGERDGQGIHFSEAGRIAHGRAWADRVLAHLQAVEAQDRQ